MKKKFKKGFTTIELVIVISVICVLSVAIVAITMGLNNKIKIASDTSIMEKINNQLSICDEIEGKNKTMYDALQDARKAGYNVSQINDTMSNKLVWDQDRDRFVLVDSSGKVIAGETNNANNKVKLWNTYSSMPSEQTFSIYANDNFNLRDNLLVSVGFDAGDNVDFRKIKYEIENSDNEVIIRTNDSSSSTELVINACFANVSHYGVLESLTVKSVGKYGYYHEYGQIKGIMNVKNGQILVEKASNVEELIVDKEATGDLMVELKAFSTVHTLVVDNGTSSVKARTNAIVHTIVADMGVANISVDPRINADEIAKTYVSSESELNSAITSKMKYIVLSNDFITTGEYDINYNLTIEGNNKTITYDNTFGTFLQVNATNSKLSIKNLNFVDTNVEGSDTFISIGEEEAQLDSIKLFLYNVNAKVSHMGIVVNKNTTCEINIMAGSQIEGASAIYCMGYNSDINVSSSSLIGTGLDNSTKGVIAINGDGTMTTFGINVIINNSTLKMKTQAQNTKYAIDIMDEGRLANIEMNSCSFQNSGEGNAMIHSTFDKSYGSKIYIDGSLLYSGE